MDGDINDDDDDDAHAEAMDALLARDDDTSEGERHDRASASSSEEEDTGGGRARETNDDARERTRTREERQERDLATSRDARGREGVVRVVRGSGTEERAGVGAGVGAARARISKTLDDGSGEVLDGDRVRRAFAGEGDGRREIGHLAVWSVASAKPGNGVEMLRDDDLGTFWQSDGAQPHLVNAQFQRKAQLSEVALWCEYKMDESYTPSMISIRAGTSCHDLREIRCVEVEQPNGWVRIQLAHDTPTAASPYLRAYFVQIAILANHQNGRDTHVRQIKLFGPRRDQARALGHSMQLDLQTPAFRQYSGVR